MAGATVLFLSSEVAARYEDLVAARGARSVIENAPGVVAPPDARSWARAASEAALFNWLLLPTMHAAQALLAATGAPPASNQRVAAVGAAGDVLRAVGREPEVEAHGLRALCDRLEGSLGRRQRVLVPHAAVAGRSIGDWLTRLGADPLCIAAYGLEFSAPWPPHEGPRIAILGNPAEAEALAARGPRPGLIAAALTVGAADAAEDCGLIAVQLPAERLGPFLDEALS
jgi:hypothetical protein